GPGRAGDRGDSACPGPLAAGPRLPGRALGAGPPLLRRRSDRAADRGPVVPREAERLEVHPPAQRPPSRQRAVQHERLAAAGWAPDIVCDDHGFPSHEWVQPFAGHSNPWFRSDWIPQGLIYAILPRIRTPRFPRHAEAADSLRQRLVRALAGDPDIRARNSIYADRYRTFLHSWLPDAFPAPYDDDVLIHVDDYDPDDPSQSRAALAGFPGEHPGVTTASLITEVADETAQGRYLACCAHAHLVADRVLLDYLFDVNAPAMVRQERRLLRCGTVLLRAVRPRPALAGPMPAPDLPGTPTP